MSAVKVFAGFSPLNRILMYASVLLGPTQVIAGVGHSGLSNLGFVAFNYYTQIIMFRAATNHELHALSLVTIHANTTLAIAYMFGIISSHRVVAPLLAFGAGGVMWLNNATAWMAWKWNMPEGYGEWEFFFFGWRTLSPGWHKFLCAWQVFNSFETVFLMFYAIRYGVNILFSKKDEIKGRFRWWHRLPTLPIGAALALLVLWPAILWMELIIRRNHIESDTDWTAVYAFIAQVALLFMPSFSCLEGEAEYLPLSTLVMNRS